MRFTSSRHNPAAPQHRGTQSGGSVNTVMARSPKRGGKKKTESNADIVARVKQFKALQATETDLGITTKDVERAKDHLATMNTHLGDLQDMLVSGKIDKAVVETLANTYDRSAVLLTQDGLISFIGDLQGRREQARKVIINARRRLNRRDKKHATLRSNFETNYGRRMYAKMAS